MRLSNEKGITLVELLVVISIMALISIAVTAFLSSVLDVHNNRTKKSSLHFKGLLAMERMTEGLRRCTFLLIPNAHAPIRDILAFSGRINDDDDYYFDDPLFPRIDEDLDDEMVKDGQQGIKDVDDDGDGMTDEGFFNADDDEGGFPNEDRMDGVDNDGDGTIDDDCGDDTNADSKPGIAGMDDDGDGSVDEGAVGDDDEDGNKDEVGLIPIIYTWNNGTQTLTESIPYTGDSIDLLTHVTQFQVTYEAPERIRVTLTLTGDDGESVTYSECVYPRNTFQKFGKRVR